MEIIAITTLASNKQTLIYNLTSNKICTSIPSLRQQAFYEFCKLNPIFKGYVLIGFNQPYRNTLYALYPDIKICIDRRAVEHLFLQVIGIDFQTLEEVAVTTELERLDSCLVSQVFIQNFYAARSKESASKLYKEWVSQMPFGIPKFYRLVRVMEFYMEEILNYFNIIDKIN